MYKNLFGRCNIVHRSVFKIVFIIIPLFYITGCFPARQVKTPSPRQLKKAWEKENLLQILSKDRVKRKDVAFLLVYYLNDLMPFFEKSPDVYSELSDSITDIRGLKEEDYIIEALHTGWMRNFPDRRFYPDDEVKRFQLAIILRRVARTLPLFDSYSVSGLEIKDVLHSDYTYSAITFVVSRNFMKLRDGFFSKNEIVTGYEGARSLSEFRKLLKK